MATRRSVTHLVRRLSTAAAPLSAWRATQPLPADPILGLVAAFKEDGATQKVNLSLIHI